MNALASLLRAIRAETVRSAGLRGPLVFAALPVAVLLPLIVTFGVAAVAERFARLPGEIQVTSVQTSNAVYWVIVFTVMGWAVIAATAGADATAGPGSDLQRHLFPRVWTGPAARWIVYGVYAAITALILVALVLTVLPFAFPLVYEGVDVTSPAGVRFLLTVPAYAFIACGVGVGLGAVIGHPVVAAAVLLAWVFVIENAIALVPDGYTLQGYMPFLNGQFGTGQELAFTPGWDPNGALLYLLGIAIAVFALGCAASLLRRSRTRVSSTNKTRS